MKEHFSTDSHKNTQNVLRNQNTLTNADLDEEAWFCFFVFCGFFLNLFLCLTKRSLKNNRRN